MNRSDFGRWLTGFSDGESCFHLKSLKRKNTTAIQFACVFQLGLRDDDLETLIKIKAYFGCGSIRPLETKSDNKLAGSKPRAVFVVETLQDNIDKVIPHFDKFPLITKKARDYRLYREAVLLRAEVASRTKVRIGRWQSRRWLEADVERFLTLKRELEAGRKYKSPGDR